MSLQTNGNLVCFGFLEYGTKLSLQKDKSNGSKLKQEVDTDEHYQDVSS